MENKWRHHQESEKNEPLGISDFAEVNLENADIKVKVDYQKKKEKKKNEQEKERKNNEEKECSSPFLPG